MAFQFLTQDEREFALDRKVGITELAMDRALTHMLNRPAESSGPSSILNAETQFVTADKLVQAFDMPTSGMLSDFRHHLIQNLIRRGWVRQKRQVNQVRAWGYVRPMK